MKRKSLIFFIILSILITFLYIQLIKYNKLDDSLNLKELMSLPYLTHSKEEANKSKSGVIFYNEELTFEGYNLYENKLIDMEGNIINSWYNETIHGLIHLNEGKLIFVYNDAVNLIGFSWDSNQLWNKSIINHHDISITSDNNILVLCREPYEYKGRTVEFDLVVELSMDGEEISRWSTYENLNHLKKFHESSVLEKPKEDDYEDEEEVYDYYHLNSIQVLPETGLGKKDKRFQKGNWLLSFRHVNLILILDKDTKQVVWNWGPGELDGQHAPIMLSNGNILIYDNGWKRRYTRVIELNPVKKEIVWEYKADTPESFYSEAGGYAQRLPNGNTLITESTIGRVFEITKNGTIVWEWFNPEINKDGKREGVYKMVRYPKNKIDEVIKFYDKSGH